MTNVVLAQLPIPQLDFGKRTGNVPLAAACLKQATVDLEQIEAEIVPEAVASYLGDAALLDWIRSRNPDVVAFTMFCWNVDRSLALARELKKTPSPPRIVAGGPEITADNERARSESIDFFAFGEGESLFRSLLTEPRMWQIGAAAGCNEDEWFQTAPSPYLDGWLTPEIENLLLVETQRGCPYYCGYCYYGKSRSRLIFKEPERVLEALRWAVDRGVKEVYLLDPSLNARPDLKRLLERMAQVNRQGRTSLLSEIRADFVDAELADRLAAAGFRWLEVGLQSTNPEALRIMRRKTDVDRFLHGALRLKERGVTPSVDLIVGLPGDDPEGFRKSVDFVVEHGLHDDIQVFPLALLPGTDFRKRAAELGLVYDPHPPYTVHETPGFTGRDLVESLAYAERRFAVSLYPFPDLDASYRLDDSRSDAYADIGGERWVRKLALFSIRPIAELTALARRLTHPYQVLVDRAVSDLEYVCAALQTLTAANPHTPAELLFFEPVVLPDPDQLLNAARILRPHYLDGDLRFLPTAPGNRALIMTLIAAKRRPGFQGPMCRQVFWWRKPALPGRDRLKTLLEWDGVLLDSPVSAKAIKSWQDRIAPLAGELPSISFADHLNQDRWMRQTAGENPPALPTGSLV